MAQYFARMPGISVLACEPTPNSFAWLDESLRVNPGLPIEALQLALGDSECVLEMQIAGPQSTFALEWYPGQSNIRLKVRVERLDSILVQRGVARVRLWKLDVEGSEPSALRGARDHLMSRAIDAILIEVAPHSLSSVRVELDRVGYKLYGIRRNAQLVPVERVERLDNLVALPAD